MLTRKQIQSLPSGDFPNSVLRRINPKHGHLIKTMTLETKDKPAEPIEFIGNRSQWKFFKKHPQKEFKYRKDKFQSNRFNSKVDSWFGKFLAGLGKLMALLSFKKQLA